MNAELFEVSGPLHPSSLFLTILPIEDDKATDVRGADGWDRATPQKFESLKSSSSELLIEVTQQ